MDPCSPYQWLKDMKSEDRGIYLIHLLKTCANYIESGSIPNADTGLEYIAHLASPDGDAMQRIASYVSEALAHRLLSSLHLRGVPQALNLPRTLSASEELLNRKAFFDLCPFLMVSFVIATQAIVEAMEGENVVHIIDLNASEPAQWVYLLKTLHERHKTPPFLKITCIHEKKEMLDQMGYQLRQEAEKLKLSFQFYPIVSRLENLNIESLPVVAGEALAINSLLQLHSLLATDEDINVISKNSSSSPSPAASSMILHRAHMKQRPFAEWLEKHMIKSSPESALSPLSLCASPKIECFLNRLWKLQPRLLVITEQESNINGFSLTERVDKALHFYGALFDCLESTVSRTSVERKKVEKMLLGEEINNIIACEGVERKERHEKLEKWIPWLELAGFRRVPVSYDGMLQATRVLQRYGHGSSYKLKQEHKCLLICWNDQPLFSVSAWRF